MLKKEKIGLGYAHSKIILMGEHAVVYGFPAIAMPLKNIKVLAQVTASHVSSRLDITDPLSMAIYATLEHLGKSDQLICQIQSAVPQKRGMGSSAAVAIATIRAVCDYFGQVPDLQTVEMLVNQSEIIAHANPSGLDAKTCLSEQMIRYIRNVGFEELEFSGEAYLVIADTGIHGKTRDAVAKVQAMETKALPLLNQLGQLTEQFEVALLKGKVAAMGKRMSEAHQLLMDLGVSCRESDHLVTEALTLGALGAKMTGGGLGGCIVALAKTHQDAKIIAGGLRQKGAKQVWIEKM